MMYDKIGFWNVRGANSIDKQLEISNLISTHNIQLMAISETKLNHNTTQHAHSIIRHNWSSIHNLSQAPFGRLLILWNPLIYSLSPITVHRQFIHSEILHIPSSTSFILTTVYAVNNATQRQIFLDILPSLQQSNLPWICLGDWNCMQLSSEKSGGSPLSYSQTRPLNKAIYDANLIPSNSTGAFFTWNNSSKLRRRTYCKLDRVYTNYSSILKWPNLSTFIPPPSLSDHSPLILSWGKDTVRRRSSFSFFNNWSKHPDFLEIVKNGWNFHTFGNHMFVLQAKLKHLKIILKDWAQQTYGNGSSLSSSIREKLFQVQLEIQRCPDHQQMIHTEASLHKDLSKALTEENKMAKQKSKHEWQLNGDKNSATFHKRLKIEQSSTNIFSILDIHGQPCDSQVSIQDAFMEYFQHNLGKPQIPSIFLHQFAQYQLPKIPDDMYTDLVKEISDDEIKHAIFGLNSNSSPGPDGYNAHFFKITWDIIGRDFVKAIKNFFSHSKLISGINATKIALIPKISHPTSVDQFRPIACCNVIYKCIARILAARMKTPLDGLISANQSAFLPGRDITDNILLASELMKGYNRKIISPRCVLKLDILKAYDSIQWKTIIYILYKMNFPIPFLCWLYTCISTVKYSLSINGNIFGYFGATQGIRQGDPVSPYLFICVMELLNTMLSAAMRNKLLDYHPLCRKISISSLLFADDLLLFTKPNSKSISGVLNVLDSFTTLTGLVINSSKSKLLIAGLPEEDKEMIYTMSGLSPFNDNEYYLGMPICNSRIRTIQCLQLFEKITAKLASWKVSQFSMAGRLIIVKSIAISMCVYYARVFILPAKLISMINSALNHFLWHGNPFSLKMIPIAFGKICCPQEKGGLGIINIKNWNFAMLSSRIDKLSRKDGNLWSSWCRHYLIRHSNFWCMSASSDCSWTWRNILRGRPLFLPMVQQRMKEINKVSFWFDPWSAKGVILANIIDYDMRRSTGIGNNATLARYWADDSVSLPNSSSAVITGVWTDIHNTTYKLSPIHMTWNDREHSIKTVYKALDSSMHFPSFPWYSRIWDHKSIPKENIFMWKVLKNGILTLGRLKGHGVIQCDKCIFCGAVEETVGHLYFECHYTYHIWCTIAQHYGYHMPMRSSCMEWFNIFKATRWKNDRSRGLLRIMKKVLYFIWLERNNRVFKGQASSKHVLVLSITSNL
jgi:hypothetical protein